MANSFKQISAVLAVKVRRMKADLPDAIGLMAKQHFQGNFTRQGFDDSKWDDVKRRKTGKGRDKTRAILSGRSGRLKKSIHVDKATWNKVVIATDRLAYAKIHNEGATFTRKEHGRATFFKTKITGSAGLKQSKKTGKYYMSRSTKTIELRGQDKTIKAHSVTIPKRQYMGDSPVLMARINKLITNTIDKAFKS